MAKRELEYDLKESDLEDLYIIRTSVPVREVEEIMKELRDSKKFEGKAFLIAPHDVKLEITHIRKDNKVIVKEV